MTWYKLCVFLAERSIVLWWFGGSGCFLELCCLEQTQRVSLWQDVHQRVLIMLSFCWSLSWPSGNPFEAPLPDVTPAARKWTRWSSAVLTFVWGCWCYDFVCYTKHQIVTPRQLVPGYAPEWAIAPGQGQLQCELQLNQQTSPCSGRVYAKTGRVNVALRRFFLYILPLLTKRGPKPGLCPFIFKFIK